MVNPQGKSEFRYFLDPDLKAAAMRKCKANGQTLTFILTKFLEEWAADAPPESGPTSKPKKGKAQA